MRNDLEGFAAGIDFGQVLSVLSKQIYETPLAFIRENVQNAVDALRIAALRRGVSPGDESLSVCVSVSERMITVADNGIGMSPEELERFFWTIGASGKRNPEASKAGCVGMFGIGGFANFGVCEKLSVLSRTRGQVVAYETFLSRQDIERASPGLPKVSIVVSEEPTEPGTVVRGLLEVQPDVDELRSYLEDFVKFAEEHVYFDGVLLSRSERLTISANDGLTPVEIETEEFEHAGIGVRAHLFEDESHTLFASLNGLRAGNDEVRLRGSVRFENGSVDVLKRGFKICSTGVSTHIGVTGSIDCDRLSPTAGRDSLNSDSASLLASIAAALERAAVLAVLDSTERIAQHTRIFQYVRQAGLIDRLGKAKVTLADGGTTLLGEIQRQAANEVGVYYSTTQNKNLAEILHARGHVVVQLPNDRQKQRAVRDYLTRYCGAQPLQGRVECTAVYEDLTRFEKIFLSELEDTVLRAYEVTGVKIIPGKLTEDIPVFVAEGARADSLVIYADVRHAEISKLETLGITPLFSSMVAHFCREYLASALRSRSPKFFGSGAVNLDWLSKRRSELWILMTDDIHTMRRGAQKEVVRSSDVQVVATARQKDEAATDQSGKQPRIVKIEGSEQFAGLTGYYLRVPNAAAEAFGDVVQEAEFRSATWGGNKITLLASDAISTSFQFEVRLDRLIVDDSGDHLSNAGAEALDRPIHPLFSGLYFPIPQRLEQFLVPEKEEEIRIEVRTEWVDFGTARSWQPRAAE
ncbi:MAG: ATP-binding protein [Dehalococcoidia bacterium]